MVFNNIGTASVCGSMNIQWTFEPAFDPPTTSGLTMTISLIPPVNVQVNTQFHQTIVSNIQVGDGSPGSFTWNPINAVTGQYAIEGVINGDINGANFGINTGLSNNFQINDASDESCLNSGSSSSSPPPPPSTSSNPPPPSTSTPFSTPTSLPSSSSSTTTTSSTPSSTSTQTSSVTTSPSTTSSSTPGSVTQTSSASSTSEQPTVAALTTGSHKTSSGVIAGGVVGGVIAGLMLASLFAFVWFRKRRQATSGGEPPTQSWLQTQPPPLPEKDMVLEAGPSGPSYDRNGTRSDVTHRTTGGRGAADDVASQIGSEIWSGDVIYLTPEQALAQDRQDIAPDFANRIPFTPPRSPAPPAYSDAFEGYTGVAL